MIITELSKATNSERGWVYCLENSKGGICKIGKTKNANAKSRIDNVLKDRHYAGLEFRWAFQNEGYEKGLHKLLRHCKAKWTIDEHQIYRTWRDYSVERTTLHPQQV